MFKISKISKISKFRFDLLTIKNPSQTGTRNQSPNFSKNTCLPSIYKTSL